MSALSQAFDICREIRNVGSDFESAVGDLRPEADRRRADQGVTPRNLSLALPYYLIETYGFEGDLECARAISSANAFGVAHFLAQDRVLDGDEGPLPESFAFSDTCLIRFALGYSTLFPADSVFWTHAVSHVREYFRSLAWERDFLWSGPRDARLSDSELREALDGLGRKLSPLKCTTTAVSILAKRPELMERGARFIEHYHAGYQLADDLADLSADARHGRWSIPLRLLCESGPPDLPLDEMSHHELIRACLSSGAYDTVVEAIGDRYEAAIGIASELGLETLADYVRRALYSASESALWVSRRAAVASSEEGAPCARAYGTTRSDAGAGEKRATARTGSRAHSFTVGSQVFVVDPSSCLFFEADRVAADALSWIGGGSRETGLRVLQMDHGERAVSEALEELELVAAPDELRGGLDGVPPEPTNVVSLSLNVTSGCNLDCDYCYLRGGGSAGATAMGRDVALDAVDLLLSEAEGESHAALVFFGGEPLLERDLVLETAAAARDRAGERGVPLSMHITTNGTMLEVETARRLRELDVSMLVSLDGPAEVQDRHRRFPSGAGSYSTIERNIAGLLPGMRLAARVTLTPESAPLPETVDHLRDLGFRSVNLSPVSGGPMTREFADALVAGFEELAGDELEGIRAGRAPLVG
ncbi:MAG: radical SAM protein, partial [Candidatus Eisenbacteria bacterium]|nr:radical SAM protein [Candidatus Eisenbacteria bacterium]